MNEKQHTHRSDLELILLKVLLCQRREQEDNLRLDDLVDVVVVGGGVHSCFRTRQVNRSPWSTATCTSSSSTNARRRRFIQL